jgi:hypothetical protein
MFLYIHQVNLSFCAIVGVLTQRHQQCEKEMHVMMIYYW